jgi:hypothetical protein
METIGTAALGTLLLGCISLAGVLTRYGATEGRARPRGLASARNFRDGVMVSIPRLRNRVFVVRRD